MQSSNSYDVKGDNKQILTAENDQDFQSVSKNVNLILSKDTITMKSSSEVANFGNNRKSQKYLGNKLDDQDNRNENEQDLQGQLKKI